MNSSELEKFSQTLAIQETCANSTIIDAKCQQTDGETVSHLESFALFPIRLLLGNKPHRFTRGNFSDVSCEVNPHARRTFHSASNCVGHEISFVFWSHTCQVNCRVTMRPVISARFVARV
ncbi:hypothetical protein RSOLAG1IB_08676 [Rhizoctonia solani AG-1 IB]|uniref:Uncharacterized protein n=1 Tax=Thanatephorus cucumeris (strain AG1-IB / isolate 7/3/14) TaxID=1108050 RepID=A0A0B7FLQ7_THACB|nr:hypothetical protein RSOLAG1IB_08676 [Rhizoctonia solani AG-1 IB]